MNEIDNSLQPNTITTNSIVNKDDHDLSEKNIMTDKISEFDIQDFLPYRVNILAKRVSVTLSDIYTREFGISIPEWRTLLWMNSNDKVYAKDICFHCLMDKTQVSRVVATLEKRGLLQRQTDEKDQRSQLLILTDEGQALIKKIIPKAVQWENKLIKSLSSEQYQDLLVMIDQLESQLNTMEGN